MQRYRSAAALIRSRKPDGPILGLRPQAAARAARWFIEHFPGRVAYAYKANDSACLLGALYGAGIRHFDVASMAEIDSASNIPGATLHYMNPIKPEGTIARAYFEYGIRSFALDSDVELEKILAETEYAKDLELFVRIGCSGHASLIPLDRKYGVCGAPAVSLLQRCRQIGIKLGITFHVGSQTETVDAWASALSEINQLIVAAGVVVDIVDVGGGFPAPYANTQLIDLQAMVATIIDRCEDLSIGEHCEYMCEPGRALVAEAESLIVRVDARRGDELYINDGAYGTLFDAAHFGLSLPVRQLATGGDAISADQHTMPFSFWGPTCDSLDFMKGPFMLPSDIAVGDFIEIGVMGAYGRVLANRFNGLGEYDQVILDDDPMLTLYGDSDAGQAAHEVISAERVVGG